MAYLERKMINGRLYEYRRVSYRAGGKVRHTSEYVGPVKPVRERRSGQGRKPSVFARKPNGDEMRELVRSSKSPDAFRQGRARMIILSSRGATVDEICGRLSRWRKSVVCAIEAFDKTGLRCLARGKAKGREPGFTLEQRAMILSIAATDPVKLGMHFSTWSLPKLRRHLIKSGVVESVSIETVRRILKSGGMKLRKSKRFQYSNDPEFFKKNSE